MTPQGHAERAADPGACCHLTLFVSGASDLSARAVAAARQLCDLHVRGSCRLTVIDIHDEPEAAVNSRVCAVPTLVRSRPLPVRRLVGDLSDTERVLAALMLDCSRDGEES